MLARVGEDAARITAYLEGRGIYIRNKSGDYGCDGCIRVTTGVVEHTERLSGSHGGLPVRRALIDRRTTETQIRLSLVLEGRGRYSVSTGIRFLDHMLELFAKHGAFDLDVARHGRPRRRPAPHG